MAPHNIPIQIKGRNMNDKALGRMTHVDDFIDGGIFKNRYARFVLNYFRMSAAMKCDFEPFMKQFKLFCTYKGERYRVTGASRLGDVWLTKKFDQDTGYEHRVAVDDCSEWGSTPREKRPEKD